MTDTGALYHSENDILGLDACMCICIHMQMCMFRTYLPRALPVDEPVSLIGWFTMIQKCFEASLHHNK